MSADDIWNAQYSEYLQSPVWRKKRALVMRRASRKCEGCGERPAVQVHHRQYPKGCAPGSDEWVAKEKLFDLYALCDECHGDIHGLPRQSVARVVMPPGDIAKAERQRILTAILLRHPLLIRQVEHAFLCLEMPKDMSALRQAMVNWEPTTDSHSSSALLSHLALSGLQQEVDATLAMAPLPLPVCASTAADIVEAAAGWWHIFGFLNVQRLGEEVSLCEEACRVNPSQENKDRLMEAKVALLKVVSGEPDYVALAA